MPELAQIAGIVIVAVLGIFATLILWLMATGRMPLNSLISEADGKASLSRFQFLIFTFVVAICLLILTLESGEFPQLNEDILGLIGISGGSYLISKGIQAAADKDKRTQTLSTTIKQEEKGPAS